MSNNDVKFQDVPKKLVVSDIFKTQPKQDPFPPKKSEPPKKLNNPFAAKQQSEVVIPSSKALNADGLKKDNKDGILQSVKDQIKE
jgi:hypothetical protein